MPVNSTLVLSGNFKLEVANASYKCQCPLVSGKRQLKVAIISYKGWKCQCPLVSGKHQLKVEIIRYKCYK